MLLILTKNNVRKFLKKDPIELKFLNLNTTFDVENPILGFVLPDDSDQSIIEKVMNNDIFNNIQIKYIQFKTQDEMIKYNTDKNNKEKKYLMVLFLKIIMI